MEIRYKRLVHERMEDCPFIGAVISSIDCDSNCKGCFNQHLKQEPTIIRDSKDIIKEIKDNPFNQGICFSGLEWSLQPEELLELVKEASRNGLKVMIFTWLECEDFFKRVDSNKLLFCGCPDLYIKTGRYDCTKLTNDNIQYGVRLASENQKIIKL